MRACPDGHLALIGLPNAFGWGNAKAGLRAAEARRNAGAPTGTASDREMPGPDRLRGGGYGEISPVGQAGSHHPRYARPSAPPGSLGAAKSQP